MNSLFKISRINTYGILIEGLEKDSNEYLIEGTSVWPSIRNYYYNESVTINTLTSSTSHATETFEEFNVVDHATSPIDSSVFNLSKDGLYEISHIILPTQVWLTNIIAHGDILSDSYKSVYYYNTDTLKFYLYNNGVSTEVTIQDILASDPAPTNPSALTTTVIRGDKNTFIMCYITECFNNVCKDLLGKLPYTCNKNKLADAIYNRDILWMGINVIKYCLDLSQLYEAQRFLEELNRCGILCASSTELTNLFTGCGCNK